MGVFPLPPQVRFPTLTTGTGRVRRGRSGDDERRRGRRRRAEAAERRGRRTARWRKGRSGTAASGVAARRARSWRAFSVVISGVHGVVAAGPPDGGLTKSDGNRTDGLSKPGNEYMTAVGAR
jgi:hypothetical protein